MVGACVNNVRIPPESFLDRHLVISPSYGWLSTTAPSSPEFIDGDGSSGSEDLSEAKKQAGMDNADEGKVENPDPETSGSGLSDFEFRPVDPVTMLTADELFSDGKLVPLHAAGIRRPAISNHAVAGVGSEKSPDIRRRNEIFQKDPYLFSPKAPGCTTRWKKMLGLKKLYQNKQDAHKIASSSSSSSTSANNNSKSARNLKQLIHRASRLNASMDSASLAIPLLKEFDNDSLSISSRLSLSSSSSSGHEHDDLARLSLDSEKPASGNLSRIRLAKSRSAEKHQAAAPSRDGGSPTRRNPESSAHARGFSADSPRMNSYGKIVFHGLERSSSSPSTFNGSAKPYRCRGMERSSSANVRFAPVLNVPVCSLPGVFGLFSTQQKKDCYNNAGGVKKVHQPQQQNNKNRTERT